MLWLLLALFSGHILLFWSKEEIIAGIIVSVVVGIIGKNILCSTNNYRMLNPKRWVLLFIFLIGPFFFAMLKANLDVAYRVITGKIKPGIVKISPKLKTDFAITFLACSITLTPGTLSVDIDETKNELYIHWINVEDETPKIEQICGKFRDWARWIAE